jgi:hypothetical protein
MTDRRGMSSQLREREKSRGVVSAFQTGLMGVLFGSRGQNTRGMEWGREDVIGPISLPFVSS